MMTWDEFSEGFAFLCALHGKEVTDLQARAYYRVLSPHFESESWALAVREVAETERFWPVPAVFLDRMRAGAEAEAKADAAQMFVAVERASGWTAAGGSYYDRNAIYRQFGERVALAFDAAGGSSAFKDGDPTNTAFTRKAFIETYVALGKAEDARGEKYALPEPAPVRELPTPRPVGMLKEPEPRSPEAQKMVDWINRDRAIRDAAKGHRRR